MVLCDVENDCDGDGGGYGGGACDRTKKESIPLNGARFAVVAAAASLADHTVSGNHRRASLGPMPRPTAMELWPGRRWHTKTCPSG
jgi:hypothetical protein